MCHSCNKQVLCRPGGAHPPTQETNLDAKRRSYSHSGDATNLRRLDRTTQISSMKATSERSNFDTVSVHICRSADRPWATGDVALILKNYSSEPPSSSFSSFNHGLIGFGPFLDPAREAGRSSRQDVPCNGAGNFHVLELGSHILRPEHEHLCRNTWSRVM